MDVMVLAKYVPNPQGVPDLGPDGLVVREGVEGGLDPTDEYGVEAGLRLVEAHGGELTVVSMGPELAMAGVRRALAMGAHAGVLVSDDAPARRRRPRHGAGARRRAPQAAVRPRHRGDRVHRRRRRHTAGRPGGVPRPAQRDLRAAARGARRRAPRRAADRGRPRRDRMPAARRRHRDVRRQRTTLPDDEGHHAEQAEAARAAERRRSRARPSRDDVAVRRSSRSPTRRPGRAGSSCRGTTTPPAASGSSSPRPRWSEMATIWVYAEIDKGRPTPRRRSSA